jgi:glycosyltransferase involved in cell wall biosynthesis
VSTIQLEYFSDLAKPERVFYVPHGIDVDYYKPNGKSKDLDKGLQCLFVGRHLRDFETLVHTMKILEASNIHVELSAVTSPGARRFVTGLKNVRCYSRVSDEKLRDLYQRSDLLLLPLLGSTANNSLLEAMACGLPIITTDLPGVRDYVKDSCALLTPRGDAKALAEAVLHLRNEEGKRREMAASARNRSLEFSWRVVASKIRDVYEQVMR